MNVMEKKPRIKLTNGNRWAEQREKLVMVFLLRQTADAGFYF